MPAPPRSPFQYAIVRVLPRVERGECLNVGVDPAVPAAPLPRGADRPRRAAAGRVSRPTSTRRRSGHISTRSSGSPPATRRPDRSPGSNPAERFHWLVSPSSTIIQPSEVHTGLCEDPAAELDHLVATLVE